MNETRNRLKQLYGQLFEQITAALFEADPIGINFGSNTDEYDAEAGTIIPRLQSCTSALDVNHVVFDEFLRWFSAGSAGEIAAYKQVSETIWHIWQNFSAGKVNGQIVCSIAYHASQLQRVHQRRLRGLAKMRPNPSFQRTASGGR